MQGYHGYGFALSGYAIDTVEAGLEGYVSDPLLHCLELGVSWDGGASWVISEECAPETEELKWLNVTGETDWTPTKLDNAHLRIKISYFVAGGGGCYALDCEVGQWLGPMKKVRDVEVGDVLIGWNRTFGFHNFGPATVISMTIHGGNWTVLRIIADSMDKISQKDVLVTPDHPLPVFPTDATKPAADFEIGDLMYGYVRSVHNPADNVTIPAHFEPYKVSSIEEMVVDGVADIKTDCDFFMGHYLMAEKCAWTGYVDWLPVRVNYSEAPPPDTCITAVAMLLGGIVFFSLFVIFPVAFRRKL